MISIARTTLCIAGALALSACATTSFDSTWRTPDVGPVDYAGKKVAAVFVSQEEGSRRSAEDTLAREISAHGAQGVASYTLIPTQELQDQAQVRAKLQSAGIEGVVVMRVTGKEQQVSQTPGTWSSMGYSSFSHYSGWGAVYEPGYLVTDTIVSVETLVYSLTQDKLLWGGQSKTFNPSKLDAFVSELAQAVAEELEEEGLIRER